MTSEAQKTLTLYTVNSDASLDPVAGYPVPVKLWAFTAATDGRHAFGGSGPYLVTYSIAANGELQETNCINATASTSEYAGIGDLVLDRANRTLYTQQIWSAWDAAYVYFTLDSTGKPTYLGRTDDEIVWGFPPGLTFDFKDTYGYAIDCYKDDQVLAAMRREPDGSLVPLEAAFPQPPPIPLAWCAVLMSASPKAEYLVMGFEHYYDTTSVTKTAVYAINSNGSLSPISATVTDTDMYLANSLAFDNTGKYVVVTGDNHINLYQFSADSPMTLLSSSPVDDDVSKLQWDSAGRLYAQTFHGHLYTYTVRDGALIPAPGSPYTSSQVVVTTRQ